MGHKPIAGIRMTEQTFLQFLPEVRNLACHPTDAIYTLGPNSVLLDRFTAFDHDRRDLNIVSGHLFCEVNSKSRLAFVLDAIIRTIYCGGRRWVYFVVEGRQWR